MAWMSDEEWEYKQDCKDKKITARSARNKRTHNGKGGAVKLPSDYLSKKELKAMNGPVESYRMNDPMSWNEFKKLPDDLKVTYIKAVREKYKTPDSALADAMGVGRPVFSRYMKCYGLSLGSAAAGASRNWYNTPDHDRFVAWWNGVSLEAVDSNSEDVEESVVDIPVETFETVEEPADVQETVEQKPVPKNNDENESRCETRCAVPTNGYLTFEGNIDDILRSVRTLLDGRKVHIKVEWDLLEE